MHARFAELVEPLAVKHELLLASAPSSYPSLPRNTPERGIYLFSEGAEHLYVGRTNNIRRRLGGHCRPSSSHFSASFAFRIAREQTGFQRATYKAEGSRAALLADPNFAREFELAKGRLTKMAIRFVEETDPTRQALLEIYVATVLGTKYNDFDNH